MARRREDFRWDGSPWDEEGGRTEGEWNHKEDLILGIDPWRNGGPTDMMPPVAPPERGGGMTYGQPPPPEDSSALLGLGGGVDPWRNGGPTQLPPSQQGLSMIGGSGAPSTQLMTPGSRSMPAQSRAMTTRAGRRPGRAVY